MTQETNEDRRKAAERAAMASAQPASMQTQSQEGLLHFSDGSSKVPGYLAGAGLAAGGGALAYYAVDKMLDEGMDMDMDSLVMMAIVLLAMAAFAAGVGLIGVLVKGDTPVVNISDKCFKNQQELGEFLQATSTETADAAFRTMSKKEGKAFSANLESHLNNRKEGETITSIVNSEIDRYVNAYNNDKTDSYVADSQKQAASQPRPAWIEMAARTPGPAPSESPSSGPR